MSEVRTITDGLRPPAIDELGLAGALAALAERAHTPDLAVQVDIATLPPLAPATEVAAYRIVSEALANAARHSGARHVSLQVLLEDDAHLVLVVLDDGIGVRHKAAGEGSGMGLASMRQRAEEIGGRLEVTAASPTAEARRHPGTRVRAVLPLTAPERRP